MTRKQRIVLEEADKEKGFIDIKTSARLSQGRLISFRLHPKNSIEAIALNILETLEAKGHATRDIMSSALSRYDGMAPQPINAQVTLDTDAFADEIERIRADFNLKIDTLSDTIVAMFETLTKTGFSIDIETPERPVENRQFASNIANAFMNRHGG